MRKSGQLALRLTIGCSATVMALAIGQTPAVAMAQTVRAKTTIQLPAQPLEQSLKDVARRTGVNILFSPALVSGRRASAINGDMTAEDAVARLISGTNLKIVGDGRGGLVLRVRQMGEARAARGAADNPGSAGVGQAGADQPDDAAADPIVVTGSRIERAGYDAPTPTTVVGDADLRMGNRPSIAQVLNDLPQFRATGSPTTTTGNTNNSYSTADLRGLGARRTLSLLNGHRFMGSVDLNNVPQGVIKRVEIVTGGASAAWGSGAVAGVVNIILDDDLEGLTLGAQNGISTRGDGMRYGLDASYGTHFADGRGHFMVAAEYIRDEGIFGRNDGSRPSLDAGTFTTTSGQIYLANDVNFTNATPGGVITSGALAGMAFNRDGSLSPVGLGSQSNATATIGGNSRSQFDHLPVSSPFHRVNVYARASFDLSDRARIWVDGSFAGMWDDFPSYPDMTRATATTGGIVFQKDNAFLTPAVRAALASGPQTFRVGRIFADPGGFQDYAYHRENYEGSVGIDGELGSSWKYSAYFLHGELHNREGFYNQRITARFNNAIDAVTNAAGQIVCRVALTDPNTACRPLNLFGTYNASADALAYAFAAKDQVYGVTTTSLDTTGASLRGDPFSTWAGPVSIAIGADFRWEKQVTNKIDPLSAAGALGGFNAAPLNGAFSVKEGFAEVVVPLLDVAGTARLDVNGAARYSHYSTSGGIWSWKGGATLRLFDDLLLRGVYSRDIRSPSISELFVTRSSSGTNVTDPFRNNETVSVVRYGGGNPNLEPETAHTLTLGGSYAPHAVPGLSLSLDYYKIDIDNVIAILSPQDAINQCKAGSAVACATITRDSTGQITELVGTYINLAFYKTRGLDMEASYRLPMDRISAGMGGSLRFRLLATRVFDLLINNGVKTVNRAGDVGDSAGFTTPKWKATGSLSYQGATFGADLRVRYVGGGNFDSQTPIVNNHVGSRTYVDFGAQFKTGRFTIFGTVNNLFDRDPPFVTYGSAIYDVVGRYFSGGVKLKF